MANLMTVSVVATVVTRDLAFGDQWGFWVSTALIVAIPQLVVLASLGRWGRLFDRLGVLRFRVINVLCWTLSLFAGAVATIVVVNGSALGARGLPLAVMLFALRGALSGLARGGGALAWHIGHLHFAEQRNAEVYMGIHVSLTGMRGMVAPLMGIWLWHVIGWYVWVVAICCSLVSLVMYALMARAEENARTDVDGQRNGRTQRV